jgi:glycosyltransferase involved in cell wall biosynthesis
MPARGARESVALIIPAHNEAGRIAATLHVVCQMESLARVLVVDDGSDDDTADIVQRAALDYPRLSLISLSTNRGKAAAMLAGCEAAGSDLVAFIDADLVGLKPQHILDLTRPVLEDECDMTIGIFRGGRLQTDLSHFLTPFLSGQRCLRWSLFRDTPLLDNARGGIEVGLSLHARHKHLRVLRVPWAGVTHVMKTEKMGRARGLWVHVEMYGEILRYLARVSLAPQVRERPPNPPLAAEEHDPD